MDIKLVRLLQLVSPALPVGAFAYSQGLESAVEAELVTDEQATKQWVLGILQNNITHLDLPALKFQMQFLVNQDKAQIQLLNDRLIAFRETKELRDESTQMGKALIRLMGDLEADLTQLPEGKIDWVTAFALASFTEGIDVENAMLGYSWAWCENQIAAAIKLVPLGQTQGQRVLHELGAELAAQVKQAQLIELTSIGAIAPHLAILSSQHETQYSRLFRS